VLLASAENLFEILAIPVESDHGLSRPAVESRQD
jgi:hypothetical protein